MTTLKARADWYSALGDRRGYRGALEDEDGGDVWRCDHRHKSPELAHKCADAQRAVMLAAERDQELKQERARVSREYPKVTVEVAMDSHQVRRLIDMLVYSLTEQLGATVMVLDVGTGEPLPELGTFSPEVSFHLTRSIGSATAKIVAREPIPGP